MKQLVEVMFSAANIKNRINQMAKEIVEHYKLLKDDLVLIGILKGSFIFLADLCRKINIPHKIDFMTVSSYENGIISTHNVKIINDLREDVRDKHLLIVEDIIDSGYTLKQLYNILESRAPKSIAICTLLNKPSRREVEVPVSWTGYSIQDEFVVGYGIDYAQQYRYLPYIGHFVILDD
ncbi:MAG: hypoxanthine phosphoribosyltransferase [Arsenophonus sp.]|nr:MAG: hypoxanthine phosphoribosyltransferase [Arsenophonus sp.]